MLVTNCFSTQTSYENQTKKAITNKFIQDGHDRVPQGPGLEIYFIENHGSRQHKIAEQILINKRSRETGGKGASEYQKEAVR